MENTELVARPNNEATIAGFADGAVGVYSSIQGDSFESRMATVQAMTAAEKLIDHLDSTIMLKDFVLQAVDIVEVSDGVEQTVPAIRALLIDTDGKSYAAISNGVVSALKNVVGVLGHPSQWPDTGVPVVATEERTRRGFRVLTLKVGTAPRSKK